MSKYTERIAEEYANGNINSYMAERLAKASEFGMTPELMEQAVDDAKLASKKEIDSDDKYNIRFFVLNVADDMLDDTFGASASDEEKEDLCSYVMQNHGEKYSLDNLTDFRVLMHKWLCDKHMNKKAYPNTYGKEEHEPVYDTTKWTNTARELYNTMNADDVSHDIALKLSTVGWDSDERFKFEHWLRYYESGNTEKYNVKTSKLKKSALSIDDLGLPEHLLNPEIRSNNINSRPGASLKKIETKREKELLQAKEIKRKMKSRLRSMRRLLDKYNEILSHQDLEAIQDEMYTLDKNITKLDVYASIEDCLIRSANKMKRIGFDEGAEELYKFAEDPVAAPEPEEKSDVIEALPPPPSGEPDIPNVDLNMIIVRLEGLTKELKSRNLVRELSSVDILLNEIGLSSYFPELGDSQSKLIEAFSYASNRVEAIVSKLRGTGKSVLKMRARKPEAGIEQKPQQVPEKLDANELKEQPVGQVKKELPTG